MASAQIEVKGDSDVQLKHLNFVRIFALQAIVLASNLYDYVKQNSGPLKSTVKRVEDAVVGAVNPLYGKIKGVPVDLLVFIDKKVDLATQRFEQSAPPVAKTAVSRIHLIVIKVSHVGRDLVAQAQADGPLAAITQAGSISRRFAVSQLAFIWYKINQYPVPTRASQTVLTIAANWSEKYNKLVKDMATKGYTIFEYVPLVPLEEIARAYNQVQAAADKKSDTDSSSGSDSGKE